MSRGCSLSTVAGETLRQPADRGMNFANDPSPNHLIAKIFFCISRLSSPLIVQVPRAFTEDSPSLMSSRKL